MLSSTAQHLARGRRRVKRQEDLLVIGGEAVGAGAAAGGPATELQGELQFRSRLVLTARVPLLAGFNSIRSLEKMMQRGLGSGSFLLVTDDTVNTGLCSERLCELQVPFYVWIL